MFVGPSYHLVEWAYSFFILIIATLKLLQTALRYRVCPAKINVHRILAKRKKPTKEIASVDFFFLTLYNDVSWKGRPPPGSKSFKKLL